VRVAHVNQWIAGSMRPGIIHPFYYKGLNTKDLHNLSLELGE